MNPEPSPDWISAFLDGELPPEQRAEAARRLGTTTSPDRLDGSALSNSDTTTTPDADLRDFQEIGERLRALPRMRLPDDFSARVLRAAERQILAGSSSTDSFLPAAGAIRTEPPSATLLDRQAAEWLAQSRALRRWRWAFTGAASVAAVSLVVLLVTSVPPRSSSDQMALRAWPAANPQSRITDSRHADPSGQLPGTADARDGSHENVAMAELAVGEGANATASDAMPSDMPIADMAPRGGGLGGGMSGGMGRGMRGVVGGGMGGGMGGMAPPSAPGAPNMPAEPPGAPASRARNQVSPELAGPSVGAPFAGMPRASGMPSGPGSPTPLNADQAQEELRAKRASAAPTALVDAATAPEAVTEAAKSRANSADDRRRLSDGDFLESGSAKGQAAKRAIESGESLGLTGTLRVTVPAQLAGSDRWRSVWPPRGPQHTGESFDKRNLRKAPQANNAPQAKSAPQANSAPQAANAQAAAPPVAALSDTAPKSDKKTVRADAGVVEVYLVELRGDELASLTRSWRELGAIVAWQSAPELRDEKQRPLERRANADYQSSVLLFRSADRSSDDRSIADATRKVAEQPPLESLAGDRSVRVVVALELTPDIPAAAEAPDSPNKPPASKAAPSNQ